MDVGKILAELRLEREQLEETIASLERLDRGAVKRRGRPPAWLSEVRKKRETGAGNKKSRSKNAAPPD